MLRNLDRCSSVSHKIIDHILFLEKAPQGFQADEDYQWFGESLHSCVSVQLLPYRSSAIPLVSYRILNHNNVLTSAFPGTRIKISAILATVIVCQRKLAG